MIELQDMVLHTWGQNLCFHPHVHCIVPGGGLSSSGLSFEYSKKKFFIPVKVLWYMVLIYWFVPTVVDNGVAIEPYVGKTG